MFPEECIIPWILALLWFAVTTKSLFRIRCLFPFVVLSVCFVCYTIVHQCLYFVYWYICLIQLFDDESELRECIKLAAVFVLRWVISLYCLFKVDLQVHLRFLFRIDLWMVLCCESISVLLIDSNSFLSFDYTVHT